MKADLSNTPDHIGVLLQEYLATFRSLNYSPRTVEVYTAALKEFGAYIRSAGLMRIQDLESGHILGYRRMLIERELKPATVEVYLRALRQYLSYLEKQQHLFTNPAEGLVIKQEPRRLLPVPSEEDIRLMLAGPDTTTAMGIRARALLETMYGTGARMGETALMTVACLDLAAGTARLMGKGRRERVVPLGASAVRWIRRYLESSRPAWLAGGDCESLWVGLRGALTKMGLTAIVVRYGTAEGLPFRIGPHALRRACATHMLRNGASPLLIQQLLGHSSMRYLSQYLQVTIQEIRDMHRQTQPGT